MPPAFMLSDHIWFSRNIISNFKENDLFQLQGLLFNYINFVALKRLQRHEVQELYVLREYMYYQL